MQDDKNNDDQPTEETQPAAEPPAEPITGGQPPPPPPPPPAAAAAAAGPGSGRRLLRSSDDKVIGGVCGGLGAYFGVDPVIFRIATIALTLLGGAGVLLYLAALLLVPADDGSESAFTRYTSSPGGGRSQALTVIGVIVLAGAAFLALAAVGTVVGWILFPLAVLAVVGLLAFWLASGKRPDGSPVEILKRAALGLGILAGCMLIGAAGFWAAGVSDGTVAAILVIASGLVLVLAAFVGGARWFILPALSLGLAAAFVAAAGIDLEGGVGQKDFRPASVADVHKEYKLGVGELVVDLRNAHLPAGDRGVKVDVGVGHALILVPRNVCVTTKSRVGLGQVVLFKRGSGGIDVAFDEGRTAPPTTPRLVLDGDVGVGLIEVRHTRPNYQNDNNGFSDREQGNFACDGGATASTGAARR
jgi:phage shock protein PspC (stress-responsive transcriptional regulator)